MSNDLTFKQAAVYRFVQDYIDDHHRPPSLRDIGRHLGLSVGTVQDQVEAIQRKGYLQKDVSTARGLRLPATAQRIPILGRVHAGPLHAAFENIEGYLAVDRSIIPAKHFALRVRGDSMEGAGILEDDILVVRAQETARDGEIVVARLEDETTVKRLKRRGSKYILQPENPKYQPIEGEFSILGVVVETRRRYVS